MDRTTLKTKITIPETVRQDKGNYKLVAENCFGKARHVIRVEILGKENKCEGLIEDEIKSTYLGSLTVSSDRPLPPRNVVVSDIKAESCYLTWDAPEDNGGSEITNYIIERRDASKKKSDFEVQTTNLIDRRYGVSCDLLKGVPAVATELVIIFLLVVTIVKSKKKKMNKG